MYQICHIGQGQSGEKGNVEVDSEIVINEGKGLDSHHDVFQEGQSQNYCRKEPSVFPIKSCPDRY